MLLAMGHALHIWSKRFYRPWTVIQGGIKWQKYEKNYLRYRLSKCLTRREGDRLNYEKKTDMTHLSTWIHYLDVKQASQGVIGYANHVLHPQHTAGTCHWMLVFLFIFPYFSRLLEGNLAIFSFLALGTREIFR